MKLIDYIINIASLVTAMVALLTVLEMKKQRKESYKPIIILIPKYYSLKKYDKDRISVKTQNNKTYEPNIFVEIANAGLGPAVDIKVKWKFNFNEFINSNKWKDIIFKLTPEYFEVIGPNSNIKNYLKIQEIVTIEYLVTADNAISKLYLPNYIQTILRLAADRFKEHVQTILPELILELEYNDIGNLNYKSVFSISFDEVNQYYIPTEENMVYEEIGKIIYKRIK